MGEFESACQGSALQLLVLPPRSPKLNGHVERAQRTHTEEFWERYDGDLDLPAVRPALRHWEHLYNTFRPHQACLWSETLSPLNWSVILSLMRDRVTLNRKEQSRAKVLTLVSERRCTTREAGQLLGLSERHLLRLKGACREEGPAALAHGNRGRRPVHAIAQAVRDQVVELAGSLYAGYNHTHLHEQLASEHGITISRRSVARILTSAGLRSPRRPRP